MPPPTAAFDDPNAPRRLLRAWSSGVLRCDDRSVQVRFVADSDGTLVLPLEQDLIEADDHALALPDDDEPALELALTLAKLPDDGPAMDRWRIYHGDPTTIHWTRAAIGWGRCRGVVLDGEDLQTPNPLSTCEPKLCRLLNTTYLESLRACAAARLRIDMRQARVVGIDPYGIDVRNTFDVVRLEFTSTATTETVEAMVLNLLGVS